MTVPHCGSRWSLLWSAGLIMTQLKPDIDLTDLDLKRSVSRQHARILKTDQGYEVIEEVGALHGTFVNGTRLTSGQSHLINDGDEILFGSVSVIFKTD